MAYNPDPFNLFAFINGAHSPIADVMMGIISGFGDGLVVALLIACVTLVRFRLGLAALAAFLLSGLVTQVLKRLFDTPRPPALLENVHILGHPLHAHSFPSGHATSAGVMLMLALLLWKWNDWRAWLAAMLFFLAAYGRIYGGVHFPIDVIVGLIIGMGSMHYCNVWSRNWPTHHWQAHHLSQRILLLIIVIEAAILGLGYHIQPSTAAPLTLFLPLAALIFAHHHWRQSGNKSSL
ncbi:MAG: phosphatase PAP2 family protein [Mariprofundaceae bacterium]